MGSADQPCLSRVILLTCVDCTANFRKLLSRVLALGTLCSAQKEWSIRRTANTAHASSAYTVSKKKTLHETTRKTGCQVSLVNIALAMHFYLYVIRRFFVIVRKTKVEKFQIMKSFLKTIKEGVTSMSEGLLSQIHCNVPRKASSSHR